MTFDLSLLDFLLFAFAGVSCGLINTLAGSGSLITLPVFIFICGLPAPVANGTNRVGVLFQGMVGAHGFFKRDPASFDGIWWLVVPSVLGAIAGSRIAVGLDEQTMNYTLGGLMIFMFFVLLFKPERWIRESAPDAGRRRHPLTLFAFFLIGIYGGFIQAGVGIFMLACLVLVGKYSLRAANGIKVLLVAIFTLPALAIFVYYDQVHWVYGLLMAVFQSFGAWLGVQFAARVPNANVWIYRLLLVVVAVSGVKLFAGG